jgi:esterase/lipase superfamily enzyme
MRVLRSITVAAAALSAAACASRPPPALQLAETRAGAASEVAMFTAATRAPAADPGARFSGDRTLSPRFATITVAIPPTHKTGEIIWPQQGRGDPATTFAATRFEDVPRERAAAALRESVARTGRRHVLLFVHGYNTRYDEAVFRFAQIVHDAGAPVTPVLFSWASWGSLPAYPYDRESAAIARDGLEFLMAALARESAVSQVTVLAHSMGGWVTLEALRQMAIRNGAVPPKITDVMLAAPDVDVDVAAAQGRALLAARTRPRMTLFTSEDDRALNASRLLWGSRDRLGSLDPTKEPYRTNLRRNGVEVYDLTKEQGEDSLNHGKFASSPAVVQLIGRRLAGGQKLNGGSAQEELAGVAQGALNRIGDLATVPLRIGQQAGPQDAERPPAAAE